MDAIKTNLLSPVAGQREAAGITSARDVASESRLVSAADTVAQTSWPALDTRAHPAEVGQNERGTDMFQVRKTQCKTCIYRPDSPLDLNDLEDEVKDKYGFFVSYRVCHHHRGDSGVCCRGFWERHKDKAGPTQLAQRLNIVEFSNDGEDY